MARGDTERAKALLEEHREAIGFRADRSESSSVAKVSIVGAGMVNNPGVAARMFEALYECQRQHQHDLHQRDQGLCPGE